uniref:Uncharacterized protein n=1 Tax=Rhodnius prolixus TaxID=13249 RepID=T1HCE6_RHOPR
MKNAIEIGFCKRYPEKNCQRNGRCKVRYPRLVQERAVAFSATFDSGNGLPYALFLGIILLLELTAGIMGFIFKDWIKMQATGGFQAFIIHYREDPDQQNLIDWIQEDWLQCCGIEGPKDWDKNNYFNCSSQAVGSREACGVPFSCCKRKPNEIIKNKQCGYDVRRNPNEGYINYK